MCTVLERGRRFWLFSLPWMTTLFLTLTVRASLAQGPAQPIYVSAEQASQALYEAVQNDNERTILQILGGRKELASSGDELEDKAERTQFVAKYQQMHRLVRQSDGSMVLHIGAENWPFPIPIVSKDGRWAFDTDAGTQEVMFRRIGEDELTAIETCRALAAAGKQPASEAIGDDALVQYARALVNLQTPSVGPGSTNETGNAEPFHGYYFRPLKGAGKQKGGPSTLSAKAEFVAYPAEYRSSGVVTFVVTSDGAVHEKDLGPNTAKLAQSMSTWRPNSTWHVVE